MANGLMSGAQTAPKVEQKSYSKPYASYEVEPKYAQQTGLGTATSILKGTTGRTGFYPEDISGKLKGPAKMDYYQNVGYSPYQSLTGGDFEQLKSDLAAPILEQDRLAQERIASQYGGRGLYGSVGGGLMSGAQAAQTGATESALAGSRANALALQQKEAKQQFAADAAIADQLNRYAQQKQAYDLAQAQGDVDFFNRQLAMQRQYGLDKQAWETAQDQIAFDRAAQLAGLGTSGAGLQAQQDLAKRQAQAQQTAGLYGGLGSLAGGLMGAYGKDIASGVGDAASAGYDWISSLFD